MTPFKLKDGEQQKIFEQTIGSGHIKTFLVGKHLKQVTDNCIEEAAKIANGFKAIAFTGVSGALVAPAVAAALGKNLIIVRKRGDKNRHGCNLVEGHKRKQNYIIIDDFSSSGDTVKRMIRDIKADLNKANECIAVIEFMYETPRTTFAGSNAKWERR